MGSPEYDETLESYGAGIGHEDSWLAQAREWVLVEGDRLVVAAIVPAFAFALYLALEAVGVVAFWNPDSVTRLASGLVAGSFSLVTLVVSVNQMILSQKFTAAGQVREKLRGVDEFREDVAASADVPAAPPEPTRLLEVLAATLRQRADALSAALDDHDDGEAREQAERYANRVRESADRLDEKLEDASFGSFRAVAEVVRYDNAWQLFVARYLSNRYEDTLPAEAVSVLEALVEDLSLFDVAQEHFKTTYLQRELTRFSRLTIYAGVPSILAGIGLALLYADHGGPAIPNDYLPLVGAALVAVVVAPLGLLASYILRTATVTRRTASVGPMLPQKEPEAGPFESSVGDGEERRGGRCDGG